MRPRFKKIDPQKVDAKELCSMYNGLVDELERVLCHIGEDNLEPALRKKIKGGDRDNG